MAEAPVQDMQDPPWKTEDGLALCAGRLQLDEFASFGFGEAELDIVGFRERPSKNTRFITFYDTRIYEAILLYGRRQSRGSSSYLLLYEFLLFHRSYIIQRDVLNRLRLF